MDVRQDGRPSDLTATRFFEKKIFYLVIFDKIILFRNIQSKALEFV